MNSFDPTVFPTLHLQIGIVFGFLVSGGYITVTILRKWRRMRNCWAKRISDISDFKEIMPVVKVSDASESIFNPGREKKKIWRYLIEGEWLKWFHIVCACTIAFLGFQFPGSILIVMALLAILSTTWTVLWVVKNLSHRRTSLFLDQLPEAIDIIIRGAQLGKSISQNLAIVGDEMPAPTGIVFRKLAHQLNIGMDLEGSFAAIREISKVKEMQILATTLALQKEFGGEYAKILENLSRLLRDRRTHILKTKAMTSEARLSAKIIAALTIIVSGFLAVTSNTQLEFLLNDQAGHHLLLYCLVSNGLGFVLVSFCLKGIR